jgi:hypothetical protein
MADGFLPGLTDPTDILNAEISALTGYGRKCRIRYRPDLTDDYSEGDNGSYNIVLLPFDTYHFSDDPVNLQATESDSYGRQHPHSGVPELRLDIDLRGREDPMSLEALTVLDAVFIDEVFIEREIFDGSIYGKLIQQMWRGPVDRRTPATDLMKDTASFLGGRIVSHDIAIPARFVP